MAKQPVIVIGISAGTRYVGFTVLSGLELMDWREKAFNGPWNEGKLKKILTSFRIMVELYGPTAVAFKRVHRSRTSPGLDHLVNELTKLARSRNIRTCTYTTQQMIAMLLHKKRGNRKILSETLLNIYPSLHPLARRELEIKRSYHLRLFEALGCAVLFARQIELEALQSAPYVSNTAS